MITIRSDQMAALDEALKIQFIQATAEFVRRELPAQLDAFATAEAFDAHVGSLLERGRSLGLARPWDLWRYVRVAVACGAEFDRTEPWARAIFGNESLSATRKAERLEFQWCNYLEKHFR